MDFEETKKCEPGSACWVWADFLSSLAQNLSIPESKVFAVRTCRYSVRSIFNYAFSKKNGEGTLRLPTVYSTHNIFDSKRF